MTSFESIARNLSGASSATTSSAAPAPGGRSRCATLSRRRGSRCRLPATPGGTRRALLTLLTGTRLRGAAPARPATATGDDKACTVREGTRSGRDDRGALDDAFEHLGDALLFDPRAHGAEGRRAALEGQEHAASSADVD